MRDKPFVAQDVEENGGAIRIGDRWYADVRLTAAPDLIERMRLGRMCAQCWEPQEQAFPPWKAQRHLPGCDFDIAALQAEYFALVYEGEERLRQVSVDDELAFADEQLARKKRHESLRPSGIILPAGTRLH